MWVGFASADESFLELIYQFLIVDKDKVYSVRKTPYLGDEFFHRQIKYKDGQRFDFFYIGKHTSHNSATCGYSCHVLIIHGFDTWEREDQVTIGAMAMHGRLNESTRVIRI